MRGRVAALLFCNTHFKSEEFVNAGFAFSVDVKHFETRSSSEKMTFINDNLVISLPELY